METKLSQPCGSFRAAATAVAIAAMLLFWAAPVQAALFWLGNNTDFNDSTNWGGDPTNADLVFYTNAVNLSPSLSAAISINSLQINAGSLLDVTIGGTSNLTIATGTGAGIVSEWPFRGGIEVDRFGGKRCVFP